jgi:mRNA interferase MazF
MGQHNSGWIGMTSKDNPVSFPKYGEIYEVNMEPVIGSEIGKIRPALIISNDVNNEFSKTVTILPITSKPANRVYPFEIRVPKGIAGLTLDSRIKADQIRTIDKRRLFKLRGTLPATIFPEIESAVKIHLNFK